MDSEYILHVSWKSQSNYVLVQSKISYVLVNIKVANMKGPLVKYRFIK